MPFTRFAARDGAMELFSRRCRDLSSGERLVEGAQHCLAGLDPRNGAFAPVDEIESVDMEAGSVAGAHDDMGPCVAVFFEGTNLEIVELLELYVRLAIGVGAAVADCPSFAERCFIIEAWICVFGSLFG